MTESLRSTRQRGNYMGGNFLKGVRVKDRQPPLPLVSCLVKKVQRKQGQQNKQVASFDSLKLAAMHGQSLHSV